MQSGLSPMAGSGRVRSACQTAESARFLAGRLGHANPSMTAKSPKLSIMVSSTVYGLRPVLKQVHATLLGYEYNVVMSDRHGVATDPRVDNFENCLKAVAKCDLFFGIITPAYGSGVKVEGDKSITHLELEKAIELDKHRFMLCHEAVEHARALLNCLACDGQPLKGKGRERLALTSKSILKDLKTIDMLETAKDATRVNSWVGEYESEADINRFVETQFDPDGFNADFLNEMLAQKVAAGGKGARP